MAEPAALTAALETALQTLDANGLRRRRRMLEGPQGTRIQLDGRECLSFASNDYLGLANAPALIEAATAALQSAGLGAGASHLLTGHHRLHHELEEAFARHVGLPAALGFSSGYLANLAVVTALLGRHDAIFADRLNHASLVDAALLSRAEHVRYPHGDLDSLARQLAASTARIKLIASDAVFSMDGDLAPVQALLDLAETHDAWLYLDDAHGFGVLGERGEGILSQLARPAPDRLIYLATLGKAAGTSGAFVAGNHTLVEWLVNKARPYIYTTASPPALAAATLASLRCISAGTDRRRTLQARIAQLHAGLAGLPWQLMPSPTPIQPLLIGDNPTCVALSQALLERGILVPAIRPPTVPKGTARLRISLSAAHTEDEIDQLINALREHAQ